MSIRSRSCASLRPRIAAAACLAACAAAPSWAAFDHAYRVVDLSVAPADVARAGIAHLSPDGDTIVGQVPTAGGGWLPYYVSDSTGFRVIDAPTGSNSGEDIDVDAAGTALMRYYGVSDETYALYRPTTGLSGLDAPAGASVGAMAPGGATFGSLVTTTSMTVYRQDAAGAVQTQAVDDGRGAISVGASGRFVYQGPDTNFRVGQFGQSGSFALGTSQTPFISSGGTVAGIDDERRFYVWKDGVQSWLGGDEQYEVFDTAGVTDDGDVLLQYWAAGAQYRIQLIYSDGAWTPLSSFRVDGDVDLVHFTAVDINGRGDIGGFECATPDGACRAVVLQSIDAPVPAVPEPATFLLMLAGVGGAARMRSSSRRLRGSSTPR